MLDFSALLCFLMVFSCGQKADSKFNSFGVFNQSEVDELLQIVRAFDGVVNVSYSGKSTAASYNRFIADVRKQLEEEWSVPMLETGNFNDIIFTLPVSSEIWWFDKVDTNNFNVNSKGKYLTYLDSMSDDCNCIKTYVQSLKNSGDFLSPTIQLAFFEEASGFDLNNPGFRLVVAIHYFSITARQYD